MALISLLIFISCYSLELQLPDGPNTIFSGVSGRKIKGLPLRRFLRSLLVVSNIQTLCLAGQANVEADLVHNFIMTLRSDACPYIMHAANAAASQGFGRHPAKPSRVC